MPTNTARGLVVPNLTGDGADLHQMLLDLANSIEAMMNSPLVLGSSLTVPGDVITTGGAVESRAAGFQFSLFDASAGADLKRARLSSAAGVTTLKSLKDDLTNSKTGFTLAHGTGVVDFPNGATVTGGLAVTGDITSPTRRGHTNIATTETRSSASYGTLTTPDQVTVTLPTDGLIKVLFQAAWQESSLGSARAAIFVGGNQFKIQESATPGVSTQAAVISQSPTATDRILVSSPVGLISPLAAKGSADVATGQGVGFADLNGSTTTVSMELNGSFVSGGSAPVNLPGGSCYIFASAGTYTISVQFKAASGSVTVKNRKLWVAAEAY